MRCVICHSSGIEEKTVDEAFWVDQDVVLVPCRVLVCDNCGERYYSRAIMRRLEEIEEHLRDRTAQLEAVGQVLKLAAQSEPALAVRESPLEYDAASLESQDREDG